MLHWADERVAVIVQASAAEVAADDPDLGLAIAVGGSLRIGGFALMSHLETACVEGGICGRWPDAAGLCYRVSGTRRPEGTSIKALI